MYPQNLIDPASGKVNLDLTKLPEGLSGKCNISLVLDPLKSCSDVDRSNNILNVSILVNGTVSEEKVCLVFSDFGSSGKHFLHTFLYAHYLNVVAN